MAELTSSLIVRVIDQASAPARGIAKALLGINRAAKNGGNLNFGQGLANAVSANNRALDKARGHMVDAVASAYALKAALSAPISAAVSFESAMADVAKVSNFDTAGLDEYGKRLRKLAVTEIPLAVDDLANLSAAAAQAGVPDQDLFDFTKLTAKAAVAWDMTGAEAGDALAKIRTALNLTNAQTASFADAVNYVSDQTAASSRDMIDFSKRVASQGEFFGFSKEQTLAFGAAMVSAGAESEVAATSFRNMGRALTKGASATKAQRSAYAKLGLDSKKVAKAMQKDAVGTTMKVIEKLGQLPKEMQASVMSDLFGDEARALAPLLGNTELLRKALAMTADEQTYLNSVGKEFEKRSATTVYAWQRFKSQLNDVALTIGGALLPSLRDLMATLGPLVLKFSDFAQAHPELMKNIIAATSAVIGFRIAMVSLRYAGLIGRGGVLSMISLGYNSIGRAIIAASTAAKSETGLQSALAAMSGAKYSGMQKMIDGLRAIAMAVPGVSLISGALTAVGSALAAISAPAWAAIAVGVAVVAAAGALVWRYWDRLTAIFTGVGQAINDQLKPAFDAAKPVIDAMAPAVSALGDAFGSAKQKLSEFGTWLSSFFSQEVLSEGQKGQIAASARDMTNRFIEAFKDANVQLFAAGGEMINSLWEGMKAKFAEFYAWVQTIPAQIVAAIGKIDLSNMISLPSFLGGGGGTAAAPPAVDGARAAGGPVRGGGTYLVGENGPELFRPDGNGSIVPSRDTMSMLRGSSSGGIGGASRKSAGGGVSISISGIAIHGVQDIRGAAKEIAAIIEQETRAALRGGHFDGDLG